jgi:thioredoxin-related protein
MKRTALFTSAIAVILLVVSCTKPDYKKVADDFIKARSPLKDYTIKEVADTKSPDWKAVIVYIKQGGANIPVIFFVSGDGKSVVPPKAMVYVDNKPIFDRVLEPDFGRIDFKPVDKDRIVINPSGSKQVFMFTDPDCPFCKKAREKLKTYAGEYRVVLKHFPLEQIHPGATKKAIAEQAEWLRQNRKDLTGETAVQKEAERIVQEDIAEGRRAGIGGVPTYVMEDGSIKQGLF